MCSKQNSFLEVMSSRIRSKLKLHLEGGWKKLNLWPNQAILTPKKGYLHKNNNRRPKNRVFIKNTSVDVRTQVSKKLICIFFTAFLALQVKINYIYELRTIQGAKLYAGAPIQVPPFYIPLITGFGCTFNKTMPYSMAHEFHRNISKCFQHNHANAWQGMVTNPWHAMVQKCFQHNHANVWHGMATKPWHAMVHECFLRLHLLLLWHIMSWHTVNIRCLKKNLPRPMKKKIIPRKIYSVLKKYQKKKRKKRKRK